jgi:hypothetical protein
VGIYVYIRVYRCTGIDFWNSSKKWFPRLSTKVESLGNSIFTLFEKPCSIPYVSKDGLTHFSEKETAVS